ncbi:hypothetical protein [Streptomyces sp. PH10-H1]|uniref:hypothetical protein n=1 Tax=Streptomyces sp. PH10-H1 TaxID=3046212 RepID=UPI0024BACF60|nr:hypothetical protein [Streptomyces sp. PH10-H1]MDJ0346751.1 hypothetical protein [Streptomyces sp. PH10-H1]
MTAADAEQAIRILALFLGADVVEFDPAAFRSGSNVQGWYSTEPGETPRLVFPAGQDPTERVRVAHMLVQKVGASA